MKPVRLIVELVIDVSTSMIGVSDELQSSVNKYFKFLLSMAHPDEIRASVIFFNSTIGVAFEFQDLREIRLANFQHGYGTALYAATLKGIELAESHVARCVEQREVPNVSVVVFTDGEDSRSMTQREPLKDKVRAVRGLGFQLRLVGIGVNAERIAFEMNFPPECAVSVPATRRGIRSGTQSMRDFPTQIFKRGDLK